jgi:hypothetical protein
VDDAGRPVPGVAAHRDDVAAAPHRDRRVRGGRGGVEPTQQRVEPAEQPLPGLLHLAPGGGQRRAGGVEQAAVGVEGLLQPPLDRLVGQRPGERGRQRGVLLHPPQVRVHPARGAEHPQDRQQLGALQHASLDAEPRERAGDVGHRLREQRIAAPDEAGRFADPGQLQPDPGELGRRPAPAHPLGAQRPGRVSGDELEHRAELDGLEPVGGPLRRQRRRGAGLGLGRHPVGSLTLHRGHHPA